MQINFFLVRWFNKHLQKKKTNYDFLAIISWFAL